MVPNVRQIVSLVFEPGFGFIRYALQVPDVGKAEIFAE
jgi:hypothetical protein